MPSRLPNRLIESKLSLHIPHHDEASTREAITGLRVELRTPDLNLLEQIFQQRHGNTEKQLNAWTEPQLCDRFSYYRVKVNIPSKIR